MGIYLGDKKIQLQIADTPLINYSKANEITWSSISAPSLAYKSSVTHGNDRRENLSYDPLTEDIYSIIKAYAESSDTFKYTTNGAKFSQSGYVNSNFTPVKKVLTLFDTMAAMSKELKLYSGYNATEKELIILNEIDSNEYTDGVYNFIEIELDWTYTYANMEYSDGTTSDGADYTDIEYSGTIPTNKEMNYVLITFLVKTDDDISVKAMFISDWDTSETIRYVESIWKISHLYIPIKYGKLYVSVMPIKYDSFVYPDLYFTTRTDLEDEGIDAFEFTTIPTINGIEKDIVPSNIRSEISAIQTTIDETVKSVNTQGQNIATEANKTISKFNNIVEKYGIWNTNKED